MVLKIIIFPLTKKIETDFFPNILRSTVTPAAWCRIVVGSGRINVFNESKLRRREENCRGGEIREEKGKGGRRREVKDKICTYI